MARRWHLIIDVDRCEDCNNCMLACKDEHVDNDWPGYAAPQPRHGHRWIDVLRRERGEYPMVDVVYLPVTCMHCDRAPCVEAGRGAVSKREDGIVLIDPAAARGRRDLVDSCPYGMIWWNEEEDLPQKCTLCAHLLDSWWEQPRCVQACPTGALSMVQADDAELRVLTHREKLEYLQPELGTVPTVLYRSLPRYFTHRLTGSVTFERGGAQDCAKGARVELWRSDAEVAATETDAFGDFVFDRLEPKAIDYEVVVTLEGHRPERVSVRAEQSRSVGTIHLMTEPASTPTPTPQAGGE